MKKLFLCAFTLIVAVLAVTGCKSDPRSRIEGAEGVNRPEWMNKTPKSDEIYYVVGDGRPAEIDTVRRNTARIDALAKLSQWKSAVVADTMKSYVEEGGAIGNTQTLQHFEQATLARSDANISGFDQEDYWVDPDGVYHILYSYPKADLRTDFSVSVSEFQRNEAAAFAEFKAEQAYKYLEAQLEK
ncbi:MAG: LPP20 family lipoprotein [Treponema sp.]|nr:LPP20 family lipoprotein [Treponema sp.]